MGKVVFWGISRFGFGFGLQKQRFFSSALVCAAGVLVLRAVLKFCRWVLALFALCFLGFDELSGV
jgi:hypothetical protein